MDTIQVTQSSMPKFEDYIAEIKSIWDNRWLTNMGTKHQIFEEKLKEYLNTPNVSLFSNGHLALESAINCFELNGEVITSPFTFVSTTHAIVRNGLTPVFCDIRPDDYTIDVDKIERLITDRTTAIIPIHVYGNICEVEKIEALAEKYRLKVIYDAAHAFGITKNGKSVANFGEASMFSFHATKVFHSIEGGAVTYKDDSLTQKLNAIKNFGITDSENIDFIGGNAKMNEFQAAMGIVNLLSLDQEIKKRKIVYERYLEHFEMTSGIRVNIPKNEVKSNYSYFPILFENYKYSRNEIHEKLKKHNIYTRKYFYPLTNNIQCYREMFTPQNTPIAQFISERILTLPLYAELSLDQVDFICKLVKE